MRALFLLLLISLSACSLWPKKTNQAPPKPREDFSCRSRCENGFATVYDYNSSTDKCAVKFAFPCFPAGCDRDRTACRADCNTDKDCAVGAQCNTLERRCVPTGSYVCQDNFTKIDALGNQGSCVPYRCNLGQCMSSCVSDSDCAKGFKCDQSVCGLN